MASTGGYANSSPGIHYFLNGRRCDVETFSDGPVAMDWSAMLGPSLLTAQGEQPTSEALKGKKKVALLLPGEWCPWCRAFDPYFTDVMAKVRAKDPDDTEVVYMSVDADEARMKEVTSGKQLEEPEPCSNANDAGPPVEERIRHAVAAAYQRNMWQAPQQEMWPQPCSDWTQWQGSHAETYNSGYPAGCNNQWQGSHTETYISDYGAGCNNQWHGQTSWYQQEQEPVPASWYQQDCALPEPTSKCGQWAEQSSGLRAPWRYGSG